MTDIGMLEAGGSHGERMPCRAAAPVPGRSTAISESGNKPQPSFMGVGACADGRQQRRDAGRMWWLNLDTDALMETSRRRRWRRAWRLSLPARLLERNMALAWPSFPWHRSMIHERHLHEPAPEPGRAF